MLIQWLVIGSEKLVIFFVCCKVQKLTITKLVNFVSVFYRVANFCFDQQNILNLPTSYGIGWRELWFVCFSGRCQNEAYQASENIKRAEPDFQRWELDSSD